MGSVVLSLDAELGWGFHDMESPPTARIERARAGWERLIECFEAFEVPATWAVVSHLFLENCDGEHASHPAPEGWFAAERGRWRSRPDLRFGDGLIEAIRDSTIAHEIGSHSYSHVVFGDQGTNRTLAAAELEASVSLARERDLSLESFVYPRNDVAHRDVLAEHDLTCYRGRAPARELDDLPGGRPLRKLREATIDAPPLVKPRRDEFGLVNVPASLYLFGFEGLGRSVAQSVWADPVVRGGETRHRRGRPTGENLSHVAPPEQPRCPPGRTANGGDPRVSRRPARSGGRIDRDDGRGRRAGRCPLIGHSTYVPTRRSENDGFEGYG
jgi:peptidoglycan/xylan/chitin deacetylase (PgdA/CDA1 family)